MARRLRRCEIGMQILHTKAKVQNATMRAVMCRRLDSTGGSPRMGDYTPECSCRYLPLPRYAAWWMSSKHAPLKLAPCGSMDGFHAM